MTRQPDRRTVLAGLGVVAAALGAQQNRIEAQTLEGAADFILFNGKISTLDRQNPSATAIAIRAGRFIAAGSDMDMMRHAGSNTQRIDLKGRRAIPGLIDSHMHIIRGGLNYNMELRWDGVPLARRCRCECSRSRSIARPLRNGCASSAASPSTSSPRSGCRRSMRSTPSRLIRRFFCCICTTARC